MFRKPPIWLLRTGTAVSQVRASLSGVLVLLPLFGVIAALGIAVTPPIPCLPDPRDATAILGTLLAAQVTITALSLAVTLFMMQAISSRTDVDDRMYVEYVRRSWIRVFFWGSLTAVGVTGTLLVREGFVAGSGSLIDNLRNTSNFVLTAAIASLLNMMLVGALFQRSIHYSRPHRWRDLRRDLAKSDVREAVKAFVQRTRRIQDAETDGESDFTILLPDSTEGSADEAVRALLDDARRAMSERRHEEFSRSLDFIRELVDYAMEELKGSGIQWDAPGTEPRWPPLNELSRSLYTFREDVIRSGDRDYILGLLRFDYRLTSAGMLARCGELFSVGLNGYRWNYQIATRFGAGDFQEVLRDSFSQNANMVMMRAEPVEAFPYAIELVRNQERLLSDAIHGDRAGDFGELHSGFLDCLHGIRLDWRIEDWPSPRILELYQELEQAYRIALMGLGGRAVVLAQSNKVADANSYLNVARQSHADLEQVAGDLVAALAYDDNQNFSVWQEWETEGARPYRTMSIISERYPLMFFILRLMDLASDSMRIFGLHGRSQRVLDWFTNNVGSIEEFVHRDQDPDLEERRELARRSLLAAVREDELAEDYEIINREISAARVSTFRSEVYDAAFSSNSVEQLFERADACSYLAGDAADAPEEGRVYQWGHKGSFTETPDGALIGYGAIKGQQFGSALSNDVLQRFCKALDGAMELVVSLDSPDELLRGIDRAIDDLAAPKHLVVVLAGDWSDIQVGLSIENPEGYEASWRVPEGGRVGEIGRYRGYPILRPRGLKDRCVYVADLALWGDFVRAQTDGNHDLRVEIKPITIDRARELLAANSEHFPSEPDEESKLRKLQTQVEIVIGARTGFRVADSTRARRIAPIRQVEVNDEVSQG